MIKTENIARALIKLVEDDECNPKEVADNFVRFTAKYGIKNRIKNVLTVLEDREEKNKKLNTVFIKTAHKAPNKLITEIKKYLNLPEDAPSNISIDKKILGGFKVLYKNKLYEYSLKLRLDKLKANLVSDNNFPIKIKKI